jgi:hypothetical protein
MWGSGDGVEDLLERVDHERGDWLPFRPLGLKLPLVYLADEERGEVRAGLENLDRSISGFSA